MKIAERINYGFEKEQTFRNRYSFIDKDSTIKQLENQNYVVPWQIVEDKKRKTFVE